MTALIALVLVAVGVVAYVAYRNARDFSEANEVVPGVPTRAPGSWAGAHHPAARLHRRLRDTIDALRINASLDDPAMGPIRTELEQQALAVDDRLVAINELPRPTRDESLEQVEKTVRTIEQAVASIVGLRGPSLEDVEQGIEAAQARLMLVQSAREELESLAPMTRGLDELRAEIEASSPEPEDPIGEPAEEPAAPAEDDDERTDGPS
ncbi:MAG: hypothetical protein U5K30_11600 [Acidimicrobiales bacterium]|nr:hypothetical protein [Acidimicrobiales bacterium]